MNILILALSFLLLMILLLLLSDRSIEKNKPIVIEPLEDLIKSWHLARMDGSSELMMKLKLFALADQNAQPPLQKVIKGILLDKDYKVNVYLESENNIGSLSLERAFEWSGNRIAMVVGPIDEIAARLKYYNSKNQPFDDKILRQLHVQSESAQQNGFLALSIGIRVINSSKKQPALEYTYCGTAFFEGEIDKRALKELERSISHKKSVIISALPPYYLRDLSDKLNFPHREILDGYELKKMGHREVDKLISQAQIIGNVDEDLRYYTLKELNSAYHS